VAYKINCRLTQFPIAKYREIQTYVIFIPKRWKGVTIVIEITLDN